MKVVIISLVIFLAILLIGWLGLQVRPEAFPPHSQRTPELKAVPLPAGLPAPVQRFYKTVYGDRVPHTALMFVPLEDKLENFIMRFNPETGLLDSMEAMRYREAGVQAKKVLWITRSVPGPTIEGTKLSAVGSATWLDQGRHWAVFELEDVVYNVDVSAYIRQKGQ
jgi:hypothetical protein